MSDERSSKLGTEAPFVEPDVSKMEELLGDHLAAQLLEVFKVAKGE